MSKILVNENDISKELIKALENLEMTDVKEFWTFAYLGSDNNADGSTVHCILGKTLTNDDAEHIVTFKIVEKDGDYSVDSVEEVIAEDPETFGSFVCDLCWYDDAPKFAQLLFGKRFASGFVEEIIQPFAFLGTKLVRGTEFYYACITKPTIDNNDEDNAKVEMISISDISEDGDTVNRTVIF